MSISLNPIHEQYVISKVKSGKYTNVDEVIAAAFQSLEEQEQQYVWLKDTREKVEVGLAEIERGEVLNTTDVINQLKEKLRQKRELSPTIIPRPVNATYTKLAVRISPSI